MNKHFHLKPAHTMWVRYHLYVDYDCIAKPKISDSEITMVKQFGFIISHEYVLKPFIERVRREPCKEEGCNRAVRYTFDVRIDVYDRIGLGFGLGHGTGTLGWTSDKPQTGLERDLRTDCVCCDGDDPSAEDLAALDRALAYLRAQRESATANVVALTAVSTGAAFSIVYFDHLLSQVYLVVVGAATALSAFVAGVRLHRSRSRDKDDARPQIAELPK